LGKKIKNNAKEVFTMKRFVSFTILIIFSVSICGLAAAESIGSDQPVQAKAEDLRYLQPTLDWLQKIHPSYETYTLESLRDMKILSLQLYSQQTAQLITDANMVHVGRLKNLEQLRVHRMIGDAGFAHFRELINIRILNMPNCRITDAGMVYLTNMTKLENLVLSATNVSDKGIAYINDKPALKLLNLTRTKITDAGLMELKNLTQLQKLFISYTNISDASVPVLKSLTKLDTLYMQGTKISDNSLQEIKTALPNCRIVR